MSEENTIDYDNLSDEEIADLEAEASRDSEVNEYDVALVKALTEEVPAVEDSFEEDPRDVPSAPSGRRVVTR
jgi:hypothetical protein